MNVQARFRVRDVYEIKGRGPVVVRTQAASRIAWAIGERWQTGDLAKCGNQVAKIGGIERYAVGFDHPAHNDGALLLIPVTKDLFLEPGQLWEQVIVDD